MITDIADEAHLKVCAGEEAKKPFVEPEISSPVDVLESTLFFQVEVGGGFSDITD